MSWADAFRDIKLAAASYRDILALGLEGAFLGGAFLSWASDVPAQDWDIFVRNSRVDTLQVLEGAGVGFAPLTRQMGYGSATTWHVSEHVDGVKSQVIVVPDHEWPIWRTFDFVHCMVGVVGRDETVDAGVVPAAMGWLLSNPGATRTRLSGPVRSKLVGKSVFGSGLGGIARVRSAVDTFHDAVAPGPASVSSPTYRWPAPFYVPVTDDDAVQSDATPVTGSRCYVCGSRDGLTSRGGVPTCPDC